MTLILNALLRLLPYAKYILVGGSVLLVALWITGLINERDRLESQVDTLKATVSQQEAALERQGRAMESLQDEMRAARERAERLQKNREEILGAPEEDDGAVAPVLRNTLERLR